MRKVLFYVLLVLPWAAWAQNQPNHEKFAPLNWPQADRVRTGGGAPGADYWQNSASYQIKAEIDPKANTVSGQETISYTNNAPDALPFVWLQMDQNLFKTQSDGQWKQNPGSRWRGAFENGGFQLRKVEVIVNGKRYEPHGFVNDARMRLDLAEPIPAKGGKIQLYIEWAFVMPQYGADRMGRFDAADGAVYELAQWYPRMAVYDATDGWNTMNYLGQGEFYLDYGDFNLELTAPADMVVVSSGSLENPAEVLAPAFLARYNQAKSSPTTVVIAKPEEWRAEAAKKPQGSKLTWKFKAQNARDVSWAASKAFYWDAASWEGVMLASAYPKEGLGRGGAYGWERSTEMLVHTVKIYSQWLFRYPYPTMTNVAGVVGGMEYPMIIFCDVNSRGGDLFDVTDHEFGHSWFPMIVGSDERRYAWMDEGFNTFINHYSKIAWDKAEPTAYFGAQSQQLSAFSSYGGAWDQPIMTQPDLIRPDFGLGVLAYFKPGYGLVLLREHILGHETFDAAFQTYINRWAYKHPQPQDFFRTMEEVSGENLSYFWRTWFYGTGQYDVALSEANASDDTFSFTLTNKQDVILPQTMELRFSDGTNERIQIPAEVFQMGNTFSQSISTKKKVVKAVLDPDHVTPEINRNNDMWKTK